MNPSQLLTHFDRISDAPDAVPRLRQFVLDLAVRGKLVEQNSADEPASVLLKIIYSAVGNRNRAEKRESDQHSDDEHPFVLPANWTWCQLGPLCTKTGSGSTPRGGRSVYKERGVPFLRSQNIYNDGLRLSDVAYIDDQTHRKMDGTALEPGDLLLNITGGSIGRCCVVPDDIGEANISQHVAIIRLAIPAMQGYVHRLVLSPYFQSFVLGEQTGAGRGGLPKNKMDRIPAAVPPLAEQRRIVAKVDELMALCDRLEAAQREREERRELLNRASLHRLNNGANSDSFRDTVRFHLHHLPRLTTRPEHIRDLRQTILNLAVRGKLVPQDSRDEPASALLARIGKERRNARRRAGLPVPADMVEPPFALPEGWVWTELGGLIDLIGGQHLKPGEYSHNAEDGPPYITGPADFGANGLVITRYAKVIKSVAARGQLLLTVKGAGVGKTAVCDRATVAISPCQKITYRK